MENMESVTSIKNIFIVFLAGIATSLIIGDTLSILVILYFIAVEFSLVNILYNQVPEDVRLRYRSKLLAILEWIIELFKQHDEPKRVIRRR